MPVLDKNGNEVFGFRPTSVGDIIDACLSDLHLTVADLSASTSIPEPTLRAIINGKQDLTREQADPIGAAIGGFSGQMLMNVQTNYYRHPKVVTAQQKQGRKALRRSLFGDLFRKAAVLT